MAQLLTAAQIEALMAREFPFALDFARIEHVGPDGLTARAPYKPEYLRPGSTLSGPTMMTLADTAAYFLILALRGPLTLAVTSSLSIHFLRKPAAADLVATARVLKLSGRSGVIDVEIHGEGQAEAVARATVTYAIPDSPPGT